MEASAVPRLAPVGVAGVTSPRLLRLASDDRLVALIRTGNRAAFEAAYNRHHKSILSFCRHMLGSKEEAEDAVQQTFLAAYNGLVSSDKPVHLCAWLFTIARNRCYTMLRARREHPSANLAEPVTEGLATQVQRRQDLRDLVGDLGRLPDDQRAALVLAEMDALSHQQIGVVLGVPTEKVKALVFQARESLLASRNARETSCVEIREQLATMHGGGLRRANLRRHLRECDGCNEYRRQIERQRRHLGLILPVAPTIALKEGVIGIALGGTAGVGAAGGGLLAGSALKGFTVKGLIAAALAGVGTAGTIVAVQGFHLAPVLPGHHVGAHRSAGASGAASRTGSSVRAVAPSAAGGALPVAFIGVRGSADASATRALLNPFVPVSSGRPVAQLRSQRSTHHRSAPARSLPAVAPPPAVAAAPVIASPVPAATGIAGQPFLGSSAYGTGPPTVEAGSRRGAAGTAGASGSLGAPHATTTVPSSGSKRPRGPATGSSHAGVQSPGSGVTSGGAAGSPGDGAISGLWAPGASAVAAAARAPAAPRAPGPARAALSARAAVPGARAAGGAGAGRAPGAPGAAEAGGPARNPPRTGDRRGHRGARPDTV